MGVVSVEPEPYFMTSWFWIVGPRLLECLADVAGYSSRAKAGNHDERLVITRRYDKSLFSYVKQRPVGVPGLGSC